DLVRDKIDWKIKWRDGGDGAERKAPDNSPAPGGGRLPIQRKIFAADAHGFFGSDTEGEDGAIDFEAGGFYGLTGFESDQAGKLLTICFDRGRDGAQDALTFVATHFAGDRKSADGGADGGLGVRGSGAVGEAD